MLGTLISRTALGLSGWEFETPAPSLSKFVCIAAPHTSNMDGLLILFFGRQQGVELSWMVKDSIGRGVAGPLVRKLGGIPVDRSARQNLVDQMIEKFETSDEFVLLVPPEGTRSRTDYWKSGFYHIATGARVPIVPGYLDYRRKRGGFGPPLQPTGNVRDDMDVIRAFYDRLKPVARYPEQFGPIRLRDENSSGMTGR
ncbi:MAG: lysophospholipid acyltransferase family protein [Deltaproteobacteria bacterium]|nr:lysophospholipid acyltransferase family protein [Deltaproteobacteria bacterium]